ncbi:hypothetical protein EMIHUDRAFT_454626, partial [Emiliania huxleyi CCMP1516]
RQGARAEAGAALAARLQRPASALERRDSGRDDRPAVRPLPRRRLPPALRVARGLPAAAEALSVRRAGREHACGGGRGARRRGGGRGRVRGPDGAGRGVGECAARAGDGDRGDDPGADPARRRAVRRPARLPARFGADARRHAVGRAAASGGVVLGGPDQGARRASRDPGRPRRGGRRRRGGGLPRREL